MNSEVTDDFLACFARLPQRIQQLARKNYRLWKSNPHHPGIDFKSVSTRPPVYSVRIGIGWRALGIKDDDAMVWFWIGSHAQYDKILQRYR